MRLRRIPALLATPIARDSHRTARRNAALAALEARRRRTERDDVEAFLRVLPQEQRRAGS
jgi:hypothetical protein